ncbi:MAG TPA: hypothetical protein VF992_00445 [Thermoplasmata archaeon]
MSYPYAPTRPQRGPPSLPFGWGVVTVLLVGAVFTIVGIVIILYAFFGFLMGTIGAATSSSFSVMAFFQSFFGAIILFVIGGVLAGVGGWLIRLWWIFLLVGVVTGVGSANTARDREVSRGPAIQIRCTKCGRLNPEWAQFCMGCRNPV